MAHFLYPTGRIRTSERVCRFPMLLALCSAFLPPSGLAQDPLRGAVTMGFGDVSAMKNKAAAGDPKVQVALAATLEDQHHAAEALAWYRKAAASGNMDATYNIGRMLLFGQTGIPDSETVKPNPAEGIRLTYFAATNGYHKAFGNMCGALQRGLGVSTNLIQAYAWHQLYLDFEPGIPLGQYRLNELALKMDASSIAQAKNLAQRMKQGQWPRLVVQQMPQGDLRLKLNGITYGTKVQLATINGKSLAVGETAAVPGLTPRIKLLSIEKDSVLIAVDGEDAPRRLSMR